MKGNFFLDTYETIPTGAGFTHFGACHLFWLAFAALVIGFFCFIYRRRPAGRRTFRLTLASLMLVQEIGKQVILLATGTFQWSYLPLHLCSINIFVCLLHACRQGRFKEEFLYAVCLPGAVIALVFPGWIQFPFWNFLHLNSFIIHILLALYPLTLLTGGELRPRAGRLPGVFLCLLLVSPFIYYLNKAVDANFFFLNAAGVGNPLTWFEKLWGNPGYIAGFPLIMIVVWAVMYLPWLSKSRSMDSSEPEAEKTRTRVTR